jgi:hypothetical protein
MDIQQTALLLQAILVASTAIAGFEGLLVVEIVRYTRYKQDWPKYLFGLFVLLLGASFIYCVGGAINWFQNISSSTSSDVNYVVIWFFAQLFSFLALLFYYVITTIWWPK